MPLVMEQVCFLTQDPVCLMQLFSLDPTSASSCWWVLRAGGDEAMLCHRCRCGRDNWKSKVLRAYRGARCGILLSKAL